MSLNFYLNFKQFLDNIRRYRMECSLIEKFNLKRCVLIVWLPAVYGFYSIGFLNILIILIILLGWYEISERHPMSRWKIAAILQITGLLFAINFPIKEIIFLIITIFTNDAFAFFGGKYFKIFYWRKNKIFPKISPNKTAGGLFWGILIGSFAGIITIELFNLKILYYLTTPIICLTGVLGDFLESSFKRHYSIKDSGEGLFTEKIMFDHGGIFCRFDSSSLVFPIWYIFKILT